MFLIAFLTRYWDLFLYFVSIYNTTMKLFFILATIGTIYLMRVQKPYCVTYSRDLDSFPHWKYLIPAAIILTLIMHKSEPKGLEGKDNIKWVALDISMSFSWWIEALAFIPQISILNKMREVENLTSQYVLCLGLYRFFYILNW